MITANFAIITNNSLTLNGEDRVPRGWYDVTGEHNPANDNYFAGFDVDTHLLSQLVCLQHSHSDYAHCERPIEN